MKKQNGFISSSSSVSTSYSAWSSAGELYDHTTVKTWTTLATGSPYSIMTQQYSSYNTDQSYSWNTFESTCYERIEYFLEAKEKLGEPYSKSGYFYQTIMNYSPYVATKNIYNGFIDLVITMPCEIRLAGIELLNPWQSSRFDSEYSDYWTYLPTKFNIYRVNTENKSTNGIDYVTYENDVANSIDLSEHSSLRPIKFNKLNNDSNLTLLGTYSDIYWKNRSSYECFFKYNPDDEVSKNATVNSGATGTATWNCKQLVIRIFETKHRLVHLNTINYKYNDGRTYIKNLIYEYILMKEKEYGTTYNGLTPTVNQIKQLYGKTGISSAYQFSDNSNDTERIYDRNWKFGSQFVRSYNKVKDIKFQSGIDYKLGRNSIIDFSGYVFNF